MTQALATTDRHLADFQTFEKTAPAAPAWLRDLRRRAMERFQEIGLPTARHGNEPWKYTNIAPIASATFRYGLEDGSEPASVELRSTAPWDEGWPTLVFVNGRCSRTLSSQAAALNGVRVTSLAEALRSHSELVQQHLGRQASFQEDGFVALNTAFLQDGAFVYLPAECSLPSPLHMVFVGTDSDEQTASYPRTLIVAGSHSRLTVIESYVGLGRARYFTDAVTEIVLEDGAQVEHYRLLLDSNEAFHIGTSRVYQGRDSTFSSTSFAAGAALGRNDFRVLLDAPGSSCFLRGLYVTAGTQHIDNYMNIEHSKPNTTSRLYYKGILDGKSRAVFGGIVLVRPGAVKTDAHQQDKNLLLSDEAEVDSKPSLEIYADDVKCGHGATAGAMADDAIFYMRSRGIDPETATTLLIKGFASEILDTVKPKGLRAYLEERAMRSLPRFQTGLGAVSGLPTRER